MRTSRFIGLIVMAYFGFGCSDQPKPALSQQLRDSLEYYFTVANEDSTAIQIRRHAADRARVLTEKLPKDSVYVKNMFRVANRYWNMGDMSRYKTVLDTLLVSNYVEKHPSDKGKALRYLGDYYEKTSNPVKSCELYFKAEKIYKKALDTDGYLSTLVARGGLYFEYGQYQKAESLAYHGVRLSNENKAYLHDFYNICGLCQIGMGEFEKARRSINCAIATIKFAPTKRRGSESVYLNNLGTVYMRLRQYDQAIKYYDKALQCPSLDLNYSSIIPLILENKNFLSFLIGKQYSLSTNSNSTKAGYFYKEFRLIITYKENKAKYLGSLGRRTEQIAVLRSALQLARQKKLPNERLLCLSELIECNAPNLRELAIEYIALRDSIDAEAIKLKSQFSAIEYQTSELKQQNQHLLTQNQKITIGASSLGVLLAGGLFARHYRARRKEVQLLRERQMADDEIFQLLQQQQEKVEEGRKLEKRRISQELHDGVMGKLSGIRLNLFVLHKRNDPETVAKCLDHIDRIQEVEKEIRSIAYDLENDLFTEERSFSNLLRNLVQSVAEVAAIRFEIDLDPAIAWERMPNTLKINLYRVLQEALTNIRKYAQARQVKLLIRPHKTQLWVKLADDGVGFNPAKAKKGLGLANMEKRTRQQGGNFKIKSAEGRGTTLIFTLPTKNQTT